MGFSEQEYWSWLLFPSPGDLPDPGIGPGSPALQADSLPSELPGKPSHQGNHPLFPFAAPERPLEEGTQQLQGSPQVL